MTHVFYSGLLCLTVMKITAAGPTKEVLLSVNGQPVAAYRTNESESVLMTCLVNGIPPPIVKWHKDGINIKTEDLNKTKGHSQGSHYTTTFVIQNATCEDEGTYICQAGNTFNKETVESISKLYVTCSPKLVNSEGLQNYSTLIGEKLTLGFTVLSNPPSVLEGWSHQTGNGSKDIINDYVNFSHNISTSENVHTITLNHYNVTESSSGLYTLSIVNGQRLKNLTLNYNIWIFFNETEAETETETETETDNGISFRDYLPYVVVVTSSGIILIAIFALAFRGPMKICVDGCVSLLSCNCLPSDKLRLWITMPSIEHIYDEMNITHLCNNNRVMEANGFNIQPLRPSGSSRDVNVNIDDKNYRDSGML